MAQSGVTPVPATRADFFPDLGPLWYNHAPMRSLRFVPLAFIAGVQGFAIFAPYLALLLAAHFARRIR
jgi:hypothetical protein